MLNENKIYELSDEELDKVNGGTGENVGVVKGSYRKIRNKEKHKI